MRLFGAGTGLLSQADGRWDRRGLENFLNHNFGLKASVFNFDPYSHGPHTKAETLAVEAGTMCMRRDVSGKARSTMGSRLTIRSATRRRSFGNEFGLKARLQARIGCACEGALRIACAEDLNVWLRGTALPHLSAYTVEVRYSVAPAMRGCGSRANGVREFRRHDAIAMKWRGPGDVEEANETRTAVRPRECRTPNPGRDFQNGRGALYRFGI